MEGSVQLQLSAKSVGLFEAFYNSIKPIQLLHYSVTISEGGKLPDGTTELPFEFPLEPLQGQQLYDTYHGVFVNIQYNLRCDMKRGILAKDMQKSLEFIVEVPVCILDFIVTTSSAHHFLMFWLCSSEGSSDQGS